MGKVFRVEVFFGSSGRRVPSYPQVPMYALLKSVPFITYRHT